MNIEIAGSQKYNKLLHFTIKSFFPLLFQSTELATSQQQLNSEAKTFNTKKDSKILEKLIYSFQKMNRMKRRKVVLFAPDINY